MSLTHDTYESPLVGRNASREMLQLWSPQKKFGLWRRLWLELARCEKELGLDRISDEALQQMEAKLDDIDFEPRRRVGEAPPPRCDGARADLRGGRTGRQGHHPPRRHLAIRRLQRRPDHPARCPAS